MAYNDRQPGRSAGKSRHSAPLVWGPPLVLQIPRMDGPAFRELTPDDPLYAHAAWVYYHADELSPDHRRGLFLALERAWPRPQGDHREQDDRALKAYWLADHGAPISEIAEEFCVAVDTARRWVEKGKRLYSAPHLFPAPHTWRVMASTDDPEDLPGDPASKMAEARSWCRPSPRLARELDNEARAQRALARVHTASPSSRAAGSSA